MNIRKGFNVKKNIRVGFILNYEFNEWLGGLNYLRNLIDAIMSVPEPERGIEPVIITGKNKGDDLAGEFHNVEIIHSGLTDRLSPAWIVRTAFRFLFRYDFFLYWLLRKNRIQVLSHATLANMYTGVPTLGWIPDFQHLHLPEYFSARELSRRNKRFERICKKSEGIILSSLDAQKDLEAFCPEAVEKSFVLNFVAKLSDGYDTVPFSVLKEKYDISIPYFHVPNQFWPHKNHVIIVEALKILKKQGKSVTVVATGNPTGHDKSGCYNDLMDKVKDYGLSESFKTLGIVPYDDLMALMWHSIAVINPSFFEGWSSTVEEAKSMGKRVILSDITVHREQDPERGMFFNPKNPNELSEKLAAAMEEYNPEEEKNTKPAKSRFSRRLEDFAKNYEKIVLDIYGESLDKIR